MGVKGLWRLLLPIGRRISIETLSGQVLAIDASIWLTQFLKAMRDTRSAHLVGFFRRLCKLKFHNIKPVFVFDGVSAFGCLGVASSSPTRSDTLNDAGARGLVFFVIQVRSPAETPVPGRAGYAARKVLVPRPSFPALAGENARN